jgi:hypothetical protein
MPMHIPPLFHAVDLQTHVYAGSLYIASKPIHPVQTVALVHPVQLLLQPKLLEHILIFFII